MANPQKHGTACKTCRRRGRKCDKTLPECDSCLKKGIVCEGYVLRWSGVASRGRLAGKRIPVADEDDAVKVTKKAKLEPAQLRKEPPKAEPLATSEEEDADAENLTEVQFSNPAPVNSWSPSQFDMAGLFDQEWELDLDFQGSTESDEADNIELVLRSQEGYSSPPKLLDSLDPLNIPHELRFILNYHLSEVAPRLCVDVHSTKNPYSQYILPLAIQKPSLLYACAALAACHFNVRLSNQSFYLECLKFRGKSMKRLQEQLYSEETAKDEGTLATILMLTLCDICLGGFSNFDAHFQAGKRLIEMRGELRTQEAFVEQYLGWLDIMAATSHMRKPLFSSNDIASFTGLATEWSFDVFPCPVDQFAILSEIVELFKSQADPANPTRELLAKIDRLKTKLMTRPIHTERGNFWQHLTEAYRHAIILYLLRLFSLGDDEDEIAWLTQSVFYHAKSTPPLTGWADALLWPLFHAALEIHDERRRDWLRERATYMQMSGGFANVKSAMEILEKVWSGTRPSNYMDLLAGDGTGNMLLV